MKVLLIYQYFGTPNGGWSTRAYENAKVWLSKGAEVTVITSPYEKSDIRVDRFITKLTIDGINLIVINAADSNRIQLVSRVWKALVFAFVATWFSLRSNASVIIASSGPITVGIPALVSKLFTRKKMVFEVRDLWPAGSIELGLIKSKFLIALSQWLEKRCYFNSELIVTASPGQQKNILDRFPNLSVHCAPNSSDIHIFSNTLTLSTSELASINNRKYFLHIGSLGLIHNISFWIQVAWHLKFTFKSDLALVFIGEGAERTSLELKCKEHNLDNIFFLGLLPKNQLSPWLNSSVGTLFATLNNPVQNTCSPNKIFDSFAAGKLVVQASEGWLKELFTEEECGFNVSLNNPSDCSKNLIDISNDTSLQQRLNKNAKRLALSIFSREHVASQYYQKLLRCAV